MKDSFDAYTAAGWKLCDIAPGGKGPRTPGWQLPGHELTAPPPLGHGIGLLHAYSGTCAIDIDNYPVAAAFLNGHGIDLDVLLKADDAVQIVSGRPDSAKLIYRTPPRRSVNLAPDKAGKFALNLRCEAKSGSTHQDVLPPSMHPRGTPYQWLCGDFGHYLVPPPLPAALEALWDAQKVPATDVPAHPPIAPPAAPRQAAIDRFLAAHSPDALGGLAGGDIRGSWLYVGMVLHHEYAGSDDGLNMWDVWSSRGTRIGDDGERVYKGKWDLNVHWTTFRTKTRQHTLDGWLLQQPALVDEFAPAAVSSAQPERITRGEVNLTINPTGALAPPADETAPERELRYLMSERVAFLTAVQGPRWFILPDPDAAPIAGHDPARVAAVERRLKTLQGKRIDAETLDTVFAPVVPLFPKGKITEKPRASVAAKEGFWLKTADAPGLHPGEGRIYTEDDGVYVNHYNRKRHWVEPATVIDPEWLQSFEWLWKRIHPEDEAFGLWARCLYAHAYRHPGVKIESAMLLVGQQGTGKTTLMHTLPKLLFGYATEMSYDELAGQFMSGGLADNWWVCLDELKTAGKHDDPRFLSNKIKPLVTSHALRVNNKGDKIYSIRNRVQLSATSNDRAALAIEDGENERRWCIGRMDKPLTDAEKHRYIHMVYDHPKVRQYLAWYFANWDWESNAIIQQMGFRFGPKARPPMTGGKAEMALDTMPTWEGTLLDRCEDGLAPFDKDLLQARDVMEVLAGQRLPHRGRAGSIFKGAPFHAVEYKLDQGRYLCWRNKALWAALGPQAMKDYYHTGRRPHPEWPWSNEKGPERDVDPMSGLL